MLAVNLTISIDNSIGKQLNVGVGSFGTSHSFQKRVMLRRLRGIWGCNKQSPIMIANWKDNIFNCLHLVNSKLHGFCPLPEKASALLYGMESCLCSGDGLSDRTAFKAGSAVVVDRTLNLLGMGGSIRRIDQEDETTIVSLSENPYGIGKLYFKI